jgi:hypothetical protein
MRSLPGFAGEKKSTCAYSKHQRRAIVEAWRGWRVFSVARPAEQATQPPHPCMQTVWNVLTIRCTRKLLKRLGAEAIIDPPSPTNRLGNWYAKLGFFRRVPLIICISERSLLPVILEARDASSFSPRFRDAARSVLQGIGAGPDMVGREVREMGSVAIGMTANRRVLGSLNDLASLARFEIEDNPSIDFVTLAVKLAETPCSPLKYDSPRTVSLALLRHATS